MNLAIPLRQQPGPLGRGVAGGDASAWATASSRPARGRSPGHPACLAGQRWLSHARCVAAAAPWPRAPAASRGPRQDVGDRQRQPCSYSAGSPGRGRGRDPVGRRQGDTQVRIRSGSRCRLDQARHSVRGRDPVQRGLQRRHALAHQHHAECDRSNAEDQQEIAANVSTTPSPIPRLGRHGLLTVGRWDVWSWCAPAGLSCLSRAAP